MRNLKSITILLSLILAEIAYGQTNRIDLGIEGSPSLIFLRGNDIIDNYHKPTIGFSGGLFFQYNFKKVISLRTNIAFERKGSIMKSPAADENGNPLGVITSNINFDYLTFPVLIRAASGKRVKFFANSGIYFGYLIKQTFVSKGDNFPKISSDNTSRNKKFDIGFTSGIGLSIPIKTNFSLSFEIRNNLGLYNVSAANVINNGSIKTNSTNLLFGCIFKLGKREVNTQ
jgi:hypothetical protein